ncbi:hypothetical protein JAB5_35260 [Janthinobacterium sp. HH103]|nr:hypothetical protein JAB2_23280 [Janthinobacterium sp. HH100]OEZ73418.1 hypothetical protein JAB5_35260 [Janthinobacterium sp. HH103]PJJ06775.1 hypothetical protein CLU90_5747 [Janthinobacterium sp. 67]QOU76339.1 hypothetical protein JAB4_058390 [Janthinobacterium sp. HH102]
MHSTIGHLLNRVIAHWLDMLDEILAYTKAVLNILVSCR